MAWVAYFAVPVAANQVVWMDIAVDELCLMQQVEDGENFDKNLLHLPFAEIAIASELRVETLPVDEFLDEIGFAVEIDAVEQLRQFCMAT
jgi:hypothetical protein